MIKKIVHWIFQTYKIKREIKKFAKGFYNKKILEIGSGNNPSGKYFNSSNMFIASDINTKTGLKVVDATTMSFREDYDIIMCINVLDDIFEYQKAVDNMYDALKDNGQVFVIVPVFYPLHDIPNDYFRFTEFSLKKIFSKFRELKINTIGLKRFPSCYVLEGRKWNS